MNTKDTANEQPGADVATLLNDCADDSAEPKKVSKRKACRSLSSVSTKISKLHGDPNDFRDNVELCGMDNPCGSENIREAIAKMLIGNELNLECVESERLKHFCRILEPRFKVPSPVNVQDDCLNLYLQEKNKLKDVLIESTQSVCLSITTLTSKQKLSYMGLAAHYVDSDWELQKRILKFCQVPNHKVETIGKTVDKSLIEWNIRKIFTVTVNNASSTDGVVAYLSNRVTPILKPEFMQMRYCSDIPVLIVKDGLKYYHESISRIRNAIRYVTSSSARFKKFKTCIEHEKIISENFVFLDVPNSWESTCLMLNVAVAFEKAFERLGNEDTQFREFVDGERAPSDTDWKIARACINLKKLYDSSLVLFEDYYVTLNLVVVQVAWISKRLKSWCNSKDLHLKNMAYNLRKKCEKHWKNMINHVNPLLFVAVLLDPRYLEKGLKNMSLLICNDELLADELTKKARKTLENLYEHYTMLYSTSNGEKDMKNIDYDKLNSFEHFMLDEDQKITELERYSLQFRHPSYNDFNILIWWKVHSFCECEILLRIVRDVLAIPVSFTFSETDCCSSDMILDLSNTLLSSKTIETLICAKNWLDPLA